MGGSGGAPDGLIAVKWIYTCGTHGNRHARERSQVRKRPAACLVG